MESLPTLLLAAISPSSKAEMCTLDGFPSRQDSLDAGCFRHCPRTMQAWAFCLRMGYFVTQRASSRRYTCRTLPTTMRQWQDGSKRADVIV